MLYFCGPNNLFSNNISANYIIENLNKSPILGLDLETKGRDPHRKKILSLQLSDENDQYVIDIRHVDILKFKELIESKKIIGHNLKFDYKFLRKAGIILQDIHDTFITEMLIYSGYITSGIKIGYGLDKVTERYCGVKLEKETRGEFFNLTSEPFSQKQIEYGANDVKYLHTIRDKQIKTLQKYNLEYCSNLENNVVLALADMEYNGVYLNAEKWKKIAIANKHKLKELEIEMDKILEKELNLPGLLSLFSDERSLSLDYTSPKQMLDIVRKLGIFIFDTSERELLKIRNQHEFIPKLLEHRKIAKKISTYGDTFLRSINPATGRVHTDFRQIVDTGRIASGRKANKGDKNPSMPNMQNIPRENLYRNCFEAREGFVWVSEDYAQQELVIMGEAAKDWDFIDTYNTGGDLHCYVGSLMFERTITKEDSDLRNQAKTINFVKAYGMGPPKLADELEISLEKATELIDKHTKAMPKISAWIKKNGNKAVKEYYSVTLPPSNRRRWYPNLLKGLSKQEIEAIRRQGGNSPVQGTGADICKEALVGVRELVNKYNKEYKSNVAYLLLTVHDQIDVEVREDLKNQFAAEQQEIMQKAAKKYLKKAKMRVDITINKIWTK